MGILSALKINLLTLVRDKMAFFLEYFFSTNFSNIFLRCYA